MNIPNHHAGHEINSDPRPLIGTIAAFIQAETWPDSRRIVEIHPELLTDDADALLVQLAADQDDDGARQTVQDHRAFLRRCRDIGIEAAFAEKTGGGAQGTFAPPDIPHCLSHRFRRNGSHHTGQSDGLIGGSIGAATRSTSQR